MRYLETTICHSLFGWPRCQARSRSRRPRPSLRYCQSLSTNQRSSCSFCKSTEGRFWLCRGRFGLCRCRRDGLLRQSAVSHTGRTSTDFSVSTTVAREAAECMTGCGRFCRDDCHGVSFWSSQCSKGIKKENVRWCRRRNNWKLYPSWRRRKYKTLSTSDAKLPVAQS